MKKLLALILALAMLLTLAACGRDTDPAGSTGSPTESRQEEPAPSTEASKIERKLVSTYHSKGVGNLKWSEFMLTFSYNQDFTGGTVNLGAPSEEHISGEFTCDEEYRIKSIRLEEDGVELHFEIRYDDQSRVTYTKIYQLSDGQEILMLESERKFHSSGKASYSRTVLPERDYTAVTERTFNEQGLPLEDTQTVRIGENESYNKMVWSYTDGIPSGLAFIDQDGSELLSLPLHAETTDGQACYVASMDGQSMRFAFDDLGNVTLTETKVGDTVLSLTENTYDDSGRILRTVNITASGSVSEFVYTYDEDGTLIDMTAYANSVESGYQKTTYITATP